ncbi:MAG: hypothetical protein QM490_00835 [Candidatus Gracilibacteria bacterium]
MQKTDTKASILIWAIFLSLIISVTFIGVSTKINKNLRNDSNFVSQIEINNQIKNILHSGSIDSNYNNTYLTNGDKIIFDPTNVTIVGLKQGKIHISKINTGSIVNITLSEGGPIKYINNGLKGLISSFEIFPVTFGDLEIENLGGYSKFKISTSVEINYLSAYRNYFIIKEIGNKEIIKSKGKIKNF